MLTIPAVNPQYDFVAEEAIRAINVLEKYHNRCIAHEDYEGAEALENRILGAIQVWGVVTNQVYEITHLPNREIRVSRARRYC